MPWDLTRPSVSDMTRYEHGGKAQLTGKYLLNRER